MSTGPDHYRTAEQLLKAANARLVNDTDWLNTPDRRAELRADAQVHATLALAAATADPFDHQREWAEAAR